MKQSDLLSIHEFAEICRTTVRTVRFYEEKGLIQPAFIDQFTKYRYFTKEQAREFLKIRLLQNFHIPLAKVKEIKQEGRIMEKLDTELVRVKNEIEVRHKEFNFLKRIKELLFDEKDVLKMMKTEMFGPYTLFCMNVPKADYDRINDDRRSLWKIAKELGVLHKDTDLCFYSTMEYEPKGTQVELAVICTEKDVEKKIKNVPGNFYFREFPKTKALVYTSTGPYDYFILVYSKLDDYMLKNKISLKGMPFDFYEKSFFNTKSEYDYIHKLCYPIK